MKLPRIVRSDSFRCTCRRLSRLLGFVFAIAAAWVCEPGRLTAESSAPLADAAEGEQFAAVEALLQANVDSNAAQADGMTALHWAVYHDHVETARRLLGAGASAEAKNRYGVTPLSLAARNGNGEIVALLLEAGASANAILQGGETVLMAAARTGRLEAVEVLLERGADVNAKGPRRQTALMWAAAEGHVDVVGRLIEAGADVHARLGSGFTANFFAVREGHTDVVKVLLVAGVDLRDGLYDGEDSKDARTRGTSPLLLAIENGHFELALYLLEAGADPNDQRSGMAPLHAITKVRKTGRGDGSDGNPPPPGSGALTSLALVRALVARGADVNGRLKKGRSGTARLTVRGATPFLLAARTADLPLLRTLLELGADPNLPNAENSTPLLAAAGLGTRAPGEEPGSEAEALEVLPLLLELGADIHVVDDQGETALHGAAYKNAPKIVEFLVANGADIALWNRKNKHGWTPLTIAEGHRPGNFKPSPPTIAAFHGAMRAAGVPPPLEPTPRPEKKRRAY